MEVRPRTTTRPATNPMRWASNCPAQDVNWGVKTTDEMCLGVLSLRTFSSRASARCELAGGRSTSRGSCPVPSRRTSFRSPSVMAVQLEEGSDVLRPCVLRRSVRLPTARAREALVVEHDVRGNAKASMLRLVWSVSHLSSMRLNAGPVPFGLMWVKGRGAAVRPRKSCAWRGRAQYFASPSSPDLGELLHEYVTVTVAA
jgi:hypothetical protein